MLSPVSYPDGATAADEAIVDALNLLIGVVNGLTREVTANTWGGEGSTWGEGTWGAPCVSCGHCSDD